MKLGRGSFSSLSILAMERAEYLQQLAVARIQDDFNVESDEVDIRTMSLGDFLRAMEAADKNGTREEFESRLATQLMPIIQQVMAPPQPEGEANGGQ